MSNFTPEQKKAIEHNDGAIIVTASAGSGKTRVMVERLVRLVTEGRASIKQILAVTFTRLAAGELKERLKKALYEKIREGGGDVKRYREELEALPVADVCTIDSFCSSIVRKYFYFVNASPSFSVLDPSEADVLKERAIENVFEALYEEKDPDMLLALRVFGKKRSDKALKSRIFSMYAFSDTEVKGAEFFDEFLDDYTEEGAKRVENKLIALYSEKVKALTQPFYGLRTRAFNLKIPKFIDYCSTFISYSNLLADDTSLDGMILFLLADRTKPRVTCKDEESKKLSADITDAKEKIVKLVTEAKATFLDEERYLKVERTLPIAKALVKILKLFAAEYARVKEEADALDYGDLERYCYEILLNEEARAEIAGSYEYVFVDEYQDTNAIQDAIFSLLDRNNSFIVGDAKQSIYGFRGSESSILLDKLKKRKEEGGETVNLSANFRSTKGVLYCVNNVFGEIMTEESCQTDYAAEPMTYGGLYADEVGGAAVYRIVDDEEREKRDVGVYGVLKDLESKKENKTGEESLTAFLVEEALGEEIYDPSLGEKRRVTFGDITILTRTNSNFAEKVTRELAARGIPVIAESKRSIAEYPEIRMITGILKTVYTGGRDDVALATALKSPVGDFSDEELYAIRAKAGECSFYEACLGYSAAGEIKAKLDGFFEYAARLRLYASFEGVAAVVRRMISEKKLDVELLSRDRGELRLKRVELLIAECERMNLTLEAFVQRENEILKNLTFSVADSASAVRVMSIHASKGLEFPVVILTELDRLMLVMDKREEIICDRRAGIGLKYYDFSTNKSGSNIIRDYVSFVRSEGVKRDEMRLLYVAMTRAEHKLFMTTKTALADERNGSEAATASKMSGFLCKTDCAYYEVNASELKTNEAKNAELDRVLPKAKEVDKRLIERYIDFEYPYAADVFLPLKKTVTEINAQAPFEKGEELKPVFVGEEAEEGFYAKTTEEGNAYHKFLEGATFDGRSAEEILEELSASGRLKEEERKLLDEKKLNEILSSELFKQLEGYELYREQPFVAFVPAEKAKEKGSSPVLVQGVIDLLAVKGDQAVIVDYKYSSKGENKLKESYFEQVELYTYAVENALKLKVQSSYLFNLNYVKLVKIR